VFDAALPLRWFWQLSGWWHIDLANTTHCSRTLIVWS